MSDSIKPEKAPIAGDGIEKPFNFLVSKIDNFFIGQWLQKHFSKCDRIILVDTYVVVKTVIAFFLVCFSLYKICFLWIIPLYLTFETINYNCFHIFQAKKFDRAKPLTRNILLGIFNYLEIIFNFAFFYGASDRIKPTTSLIQDGSLKFLDYIYFSTVTGTTVGYGDLVAVGKLGHCIVIFQIFTFIMFFSIFITYNLSLFVNKA